MDNIHISHEDRDESIFCFIASNDTISVIADLGVATTQRHQENLDNMAIYTRYGATWSIMDRVGIILDTIKDTGFMGHGDALIWL